LTVFAGQRITASLLNQLYGQADGVQSVVTGTSFTNLSSPYVIPAGEPQAGSAYEMTVGGTGTWPTYSTPSTTLTIVPGVNGSAHGSGSGGVIAADAFASGVAVQWKARVSLVCIDGVSAWQANLDSILQQGTHAADVAQYSVGACVSVGITAAVTSAITVSIMAAWSNTNSPGISNSFTMFRKVA
jgi:hypothetical protein